MEMIKFSWPTGNVDCSYAGLSEPGVPWNPQIFLWLSFSCSQVVIFCSEKVIIWVKNNDVFTHIITFLTQATLFEQKKLLFHDLWAREKKDQKIGPLTLSKTSRGADYVHQINTDPPGFSDLLTALLHIIPFICLKFSAFSTEIYQIVGRILLWSSKFRLEKLKKQTNWPTHPPTHYVCQHKCST